MALDIYLPSPFRLSAHDVLDSTNAEAKRAAATDANHLVVWAREQTAGRGRRGRDWVSPPGNLYCSFLMRPEFPPHVAMRVGFVASIALADTVASVLPKSSYVHTKWPNDVLVEDKKIAGILMESALDDAGGLDWAVIGTGVNIASHPDGTPYPATHLHGEGGAAVTDAKLLEIYVLRFLAWYVTWKKLGFGPVRQAWLRRARGLGQPITVRLPNEELSGVFEALDEDGALILATEEGKRRIAAGDVFPTAPFERMDEPTRDTA